MLNTTVSDQICTNIASLIDEKLEKLSTNTQSSSVDFESINNKLQELSSEIHDFKHSMVVSSHQNPAAQSLTSDIKSIIKDQDPETAPINLIKAHGNLEENFIDDDYALQLHNFLEASEFSTEGQRKVLFFGEKYKYMGSSKSPKPMPNILSPLLEKINNTTEFKVNQCLINMYDGPNASLPKHSDNEAVIHPQSEIFTLSLGDAATIAFSKMNDDNTMNLTVPHKSLYSMSRQSQGVFKHEILPNPQNTKRYSLTFRSVHWTNLNSTIAIGDSNFGGLKFGEGKGNFGTATPGKKEWSAKVENIAPHQSLGYQNVVVMCGTNDLKVNMENEEEEEIMEIYKVYKGKFEEIRRINQKCKLFVCPVLPTRDQAINNRIKVFNKLIVTDLLQTNLGVHLVEGFLDFVDQTNWLLKESLFSKHFDGDTLHINNRGYCILVKCIKTTIFRCKNLGKNSTNQRVYSNVVRGGPPRPL